MGSTLLDGGTHCIQQHNGSIPSGDALLRLEGSIWIAANQPILCRCGYQSTAPSADVFTVIEIGVCTHRWVHHQILCQDKGCRLTGNALIWCKDSGCHTSNIALLIAYRHILFVPIISIDIFEGMCSNDIISKCTVDNRDKLCSCNGVLRAHIPCGIPTHKAQFCHPFHVGVRIGGL